MFTRFFDLSSGGCSKEEFDVIIIEAPIEEAKQIFYDKFGHDPEHVTCDCCGADYSISECETLEQATSYYSEHTTLIIKKDNK